VLSTRRAAPRQKVPDTFVPKAPTIVNDLYLAYGTDEKLGAAIFEQWQYDPNDPNTLWGADAGTGDTRATSS
jgi:hypothetical protein